MRFICVPTIAYASHMRRTYPTRYLPFRFRHKNPINPSRSSFPAALCCLLHASNSSEPFDREILNKVPKLDGAKIDALSSRRLKVTDRAMTRRSGSPRDIYPLALLFFSLFKLSGLATISMNRRATPSRKISSGGPVSFAVSPLGVIYNLFLACLMLASTLITIPILYYSEYEHKTVMTTIIEVFQAVLGSLVVSLVLLLYCANRSILLEIVNYLIKIERSLHGLRHPVPWRRAFYALLTICAFHANLCAILAATDYLCFHVHPVTWTANIVPATFVGLLFIQYLSVLTLAGAGFAALNAGLRKLCGSCSDAGPACFAGTRAFVGCSSTPVLAKIRETHDRLCDVTATVSQFYSLPVLIGSSFTFFALVYNTYYLLKPVMVDNVSLSGLVLANTLLWIAYLLCPLGLLTAKVTGIAQEVERTGGIVHALLNRAVNREARAELKQFSLQLLHRRIKFSASGYFALDNTFFQAVLSTVTTYMIILIQFQMGAAKLYPDSCNCTR